VSRISDCSHLLGKRIQTVSGDEPCRLHIVLFEQLEEPGRPDFARIQSLVIRQYPLLAIGGELTREMSPGLSSPPYEPSLRYQRVSYGEQEICERQTYHPATASTSTPMLSPYQYEVSRW
jgi:hypothetical protein